MIAGNDIDGSVPESFPNGLDVPLFPKRRIYLGVDVVTAQAVRGKGEIMGSRFGGYLDAPGLGIPDEADGAGGGNMTDMQRRPGVFRQQEVPGDHDLLGDSRDSGQTELRGGQSFVHGPAGGQGEILAVGNHRQSQGMGVFQRPAHDGAIHDGFAVVGKGDGSCFLEVPELRQGFPLGTQRNGGDGINMDEVRLSGLAEDEFRDGTVVIHGTGIGHTGHRGESADGGRRASRGNGFLVFIARLPEMDMHIDETGGDDEAPQLHDPESFSLLLAQIATDPGDAAALHEDIHSVVQAPAGIDHPCPAEQPVLSR